MKKSVIILTAVVYFVAIVTVAFLGFVAEIHNPPIFAEDIIMEFEDEPNFPEENYTFYYQYTPIYDVIYNPNFDSAVKGDDKYKYFIKFRGSEEFKLFYEDINLLELHTKPYSSEGECETQELQYYMADARKDFVSVDKKGGVKFKVYDDSGLEEVRVSTMDGTNKTIYIQITWK